MLLGPSPSSRSPPKTLDPEPFPSPGDGVQIPPDLIRDFVIWSRSEQSIFVGLERTPSGRRMSPLARWASLIFTRVSADGDRPLFAFRIA